MTAQRWLLVGAVALAATATLIWWQLSQDLATARTRSSFRSTLIETPCGLIEYQEAGTGQPMLAVHGSGGGFDQGLAFAAQLAAQGMAPMPLPNTWPDRSQARGFRALNPAAIPGSATIWVGHNDEVMAAVAALVTSPHDGKPWGLHPPE